MAQYKVPQDVEADDKLLGPFSFRQFIYLLIAGGLIAVIIGLFQLPQPIPLLSIIPVPIIILFLLLALPLKKDQPMETYLAALVSFYLKPHNRLWVPGQRESYIEITAPKTIEAPRARNISGEEADSRLSFLAEIVDTEGKSIREHSTNLRDDLAAEANATVDMFDNINSFNLDKMIDREHSNQHTEAVNQMKAAIDKIENPLTGSVPTTTPNHSTPTITTSHQTSPASPSATPPVTNSNINQPAPTPSPTPITTTAARPASDPNPTPITPPPQNTSAKTIKQGIIDLAGNTEYSVATISKVAQHINDKKSNDEVYVALH